MIKAIIFDCWGTLFYKDLMPHPHDEFAKKLGKSMSDYSYLKIFEKNLMLERCNDVESAIRNLLKDLKINANRKLIRELANILVVKGTKNIKPYPETSQVLKELKKNFKLGLISNTFSPVFENLEKKYGLKNIFDVIVTSYEVGVMKPNPKIFDIALEKLGVGKEEVLLIGDHIEDDIRAAEKIGIKSILIDRDGKYPNYPNRITSLAQLRG